MSYIEDIRNEVDSGNSTTSLLGAGATFTGTWTKVVDYTTIAVAILGDNDSDGTLWIDVRKESSAIVSSVPFTIPTVLSDARNLPHIWNIVEDEYRIRYINGTTAQTGTFNLTTKLSVNQELGLVSSVDGTIYNNHPVNLFKVANTITQDRNFGRLGNEQSKRIIGRNAAVPGSGFETIWSGADNSLPAIYPTATAAETVRVKSGGNANDDVSGSGARKVMVYGLDASFNEISEEISLAGTSASSATTNSFIAINEVCVSEWGTFEGENSGAIIIENTSSTQGLAAINAGVGRAQSCIYTIPAGKTMYMKNISLAVGDNNTADVSLYSFKDLSDQTAPLTAGKFIEWEVVDYAGARTFAFDTYLKFQEKSFVRFDAKRNSGSGNAFISLTFDFILLDN